MLRACGIAALVVVARTSTASAAESVADNRDGEDRNGVRIAIRSGVALPVGEIYDASGPISDSASGYVPARVDVGVRFARQRLYLGAAGQLAAIVPNACTSSAHCSGMDARLAVMFAVHLMPQHSVDPWVGVGLGYERLSLTRGSDSVKVDLVASGLELVDLDIGVDFRPASRVRIGPVVSATLSRFTSVAVNGGESQDFDPTLHSWIMLGLRGAYDL